MEIKYFGHTCFRIRGSKVAIVTDPLEANLGVKLPSITADIVLFSNQEGKNLSIVTKALGRDEPFVINGPGEYEVAGVFVLGISSGKTTIYVITIDGLRLVFLGELNEKLSDKQLEEINGVDLLFLPVGGKPVSLAGQIQPKMVIPMAYKLPGLRLDLAPVDDFLRQMGVEGIKPIDKLLISKEKLPLEKEVVMLHARS